MGVVYKGYEPALSRYVAIKELSPILAHDPAVVERFLREARSMAMLNDPHIIQIYSIGQEEGLPFFVMEFVDGSSVAAIIQRDLHLYPEDAMKIVHQTAQGLSAAHERGVIHRDIKPANLILSQRGQVKIADFGIALANADMNQKLTSAGEMVGTPGYLPPELLLGRPVDQRSDVYALGVVLFEMLTGRTPFSDASVYKLMLDVVQTEIPDVREINSEIDPGVAAILAKMLIKDPAKRYQSMAELAADLEKHPLVARGGPLRLGLRPSSTAHTEPRMSIPSQAGAIRAPAAPPVMDRRGPLATPTVVSSPGRVMTPPPGTPAPAASSSPTPSSSGAGCPRARSSSSTRC
jgi:serine/threonine-protein kinase